MKVIQILNVQPEKITHQPKVDPEFELRRGPGSFLLAQLAFLPSVISYFFARLNKVRSRAIKVSRVQSSCNRIGHKKFRVGLSFVKLNRAR